MKAPYTNDVWRLSRDWDTVVVTGSMKYDGSGQQNHVLANKETVPAGWRPNGGRPDDIYYAVVSATNIGWCNFVRPSGRIIMLGDTKGVYSGVTGGWQCVEWRA